MFIVTQNGKDAKFGSLRDSLLDVSNKLGPFVERYIVHDNELGYCIAHVIMSNEVENRVSWYLITHNNAIYYSSTQEQFSKYVESYCFQCLTVN